MLDNGGGNREYQLPSVVTIVRVHHNIIRTEISVGSGVEYCSGPHNWGPMLVQFVEIGTVS